MLRGTFGGVRMIYLIWTRFIETLKSRGGNRFCCNDVVSCLRLIAFISRKYVMVSEMFEEFILEVVESKSSNSKSSKKNKVT